MCADIDKFFPAWSIWDICNLKRILYEYKCKYMETHQLVICCSSFIFSPLTKCRKSVKNGVRSFREILILHTYLEETQQIHDEQFRVYDVPLSPNNPWSTGSTSPSDLGATTKNMFQKMCLPENRENIDSFRSFSIPSGKLTVCY